MTEVGFKMCPSCRGAGDIEEDDGWPTPCGRCFGSGELEVFKVWRGKPVHAPVEPDQLGLL